MIVASLFAHEQFYSSLEEAERALSKFCFDCVIHGVAQKNLKMDSEFKKTFTELHQREQYREAVALWNKRSVKGSFLHACIENRSLSVDQKFQPNSSFGYLIESII